MGAKFQLKWPAAAFTFAVTLIINLTLGLIVSAENGGNTFGAGAIVGWAAVTIYLWIASIRAKEVEPRLGWCVIGATLLIALFLVYCFIFVW